MMRKIFTFDPNWVAFCGLYLDDWALLLRRRSHIPTYRSMINTCLPISQKKISIKIHRF